MDAKTIISEPTACWLNPDLDQTNNSQIAISTRIRLARNLAKVPFPNSLDDCGAELVETDINKAIGAKLSIEGQIDDEFFFLKLDKLTPTQCGILFEKHFISQNLLAKPVGREVIINHAQSLAIMVNEEDHLRLQCILPGLDLKQAWQKVSQLDDVLEQKLDFAYDPQLGFLTACPSNVGTGLRASVMLHLPGLALTNKLKGVIKNLQGLGLTIRGMYGEGSKSYGHLYQISNQVSLGYSEQAIINNLQDFAENIIAMEAKARQSLWQSSYRKMVDRIWRSYYILAKAQLISVKEAMEHISILRLGIYYDVLKNVSTSKLNCLMVNCQTAFLEDKSEFKLSQEDLDWERAKVIRKYFE